MIILLYSQKTTYLLIYCIVKLDNSKHLIYFYTFEIEFVFYHFRCIMLFYLVLLNENYVSFRSGTLEALGFVVYMIFLLLTIFCWCDVDLVTIILPN